MTNLLFLTRHQFIAVKFCACLITTAVSFPAYTMESAEEDSVQSMATHEGKDKNSLKRKFLAKLKRSPDRDRKITKDNRTQSLSSIKFQAKKKSQAEEPALTADSRSSFKTEQKNNDRIQQAEPPRDIFSHSEESENGELKEDYDLILQQLANYVARDFCGLIDDKGLTEATREDDLRKRAFLNFLPEPFYRAIYRMLALSFEEYQAIKTQRALRRYEKFQNKKAHAHDSMTLIMEEKQTEINELMPNIAECQRAKYVLPKVYERLLQELKDKRQVHAYLLNIFGLYALSPSSELAHSDDEDHGDFLKGRFVHDDKTSQERYHSFRGEMMQLLAISETGIQEEENFWHDAMAKNMKSPIAAQLYALFVRAIEAFVEQGESAD